jgi:selenocysteine-specific elongation factor
MLPGESKALRHWTPVHIHLGAIDVTGRVAVLDGQSIKPGESGRVQLVLDHPVGALRGDRLILRDQSAQRTIGGGWIIDPFSPKRGRRTPDRLAVLEAMEVEEADARLSMLLDRASGGIDLQRLATAWNLPSAEAEKLWRSVDMVRTGKPDAPVGFSRAQWAAMQDSALAQLRAWHDKSPDQPGPGEAQLLRTMPQRLREDLFSALVLELIRDKRVLRDGSSLHLPGHRAALAPSDAAMWERILPLLDVDHLRPPRIRELAEELDYDLKPLEQLLMRVTRMGMLYRVADNRYYLPDTLRQLAEIAETVAKSAEDGTFDVRDYRDATGIGRNVTIQVLEFFDKQGFTRRTGDNRAIHQSSAEVFG